MRGMARRQGRKGQRTGRDIALLLFATIFLAALIVWAGRFLPTHKVVPWPVTSGTAAPAPTPPLPTIDPIALHAQWVTQVHGILDDISATSTPDQVEGAKQALLQMRVTATDRQTHLALVLDLVAMQEGRPGAAALLAQTLATVRD